MLTPNELEAIPMGIIEIFHNLQMEIAGDVVKRIAKNREITSTAGWQITRLYELGTSKQFIEKEIKRTLGLSNAELDKIYKNALAEDYTRYKPAYQKQGKPFIPFKKNAPLQQLISGVKEQTKGTFKNITQSLGFSVRNTNGTTSFLPIADYYQRTLDKASFEILSGTYDYNSVLKRTVREMSNSGLRTVEYASGHVNRIDVAARRATMTGFNQVVGKITEENAKELDTEYYEVSYHAGARPEHQKWQGKVYTMDELISICGYGDVDGLLGAGCRHDFNLFFPGISKRTYTDEELDEMNQKENTPTEYDGKEYTGYEATQRQRDLESRMRIQREEISLFEQGGADEKDIDAAKAKYHALSAEYSKFSKAMDLPQQRERVNISPFGGVDTNIGSAII